MQEAKVPGGRRFTFFSGRKPSRSCPNDEPPPSWRRRFRIDQVLRVWSKPSFGIVALPHGQGTLGTWAISALQMRLLRVLWHVIEKALLLSVRRCSIGMDRSYRASGRRHMLASTQERPCLPYTSFTDASEVVFPANQECVLSQASDSSSP